MEDILIQRAVRITGKKARPGDRIFIPLADGGTMAGTVVSVNGNEKTIFPDECLTRLPYELVDKWMCEDFAKIFPEKVAAKIGKPVLPSWGQLFGHEYGRYSCVTSDQDEPFALTKRDRIGIFEGQIEQYWMRNDTGWIFTEHHSWTYVDKRGEPEFGDWTFFKGVRPIFTLR